jgi:voltage-gated potassium channel
LVMLAGTLLGFAVFYLFFPRGLHIALAQATMQAGYMCAFVFFQQANFPQAPPWTVQLGFILPLLAFLAGALGQRTRIGRVIETEASRPVRFNHVMRWVLPLVLVGATGFVVPDLMLSDIQEGAAFLIAMAAIATVVGLAARDVVVFILDTSQVFEAFFSRIVLLAVPAFAFMVFWSLLAVVFACLYRIADLTTPEPLFAVLGTPARLEFGEALYFSVVTLATVGYGDITPIAPLSRMLAVAQMVLGLLLLLFGVNELIRYAEPPPPGDASGK